MVHSERVNFRIDRVTSRKLKELTAATGITASEIFRLLVELATPEMLTKKKPSEKQADKSNT